MKNRRRPFKEDGSPKAFDTGTIKVCHLKPVHNKIPHITWKIAFERFVIELIKGRKNLSKEPNAMGLKFFVWIGLFFVLLSGCDSVSEGKPVEGEKEEGEMVDVVAEHLQTPWSIDDDGTAFYISERVGQLVKVEEGKVVRQPVHFKKPLSEASEAGFLGFVLHPTEKDSAYGYYTYEEGTDRFNRVVRLILKDDGWHEEKTYIDRIPSGQIHHGGRIKIGPDGFVYITTGDGGSAERAQDLASMNGKILRMKTDGTVPKDNPFSHSYIYSFGHRNPQGLAWDEKGQLYASEHGQSAHDEINVIEPGANYGWPLIQGDEKREGMKSPFIHSGDVTWAPSGMVHHDGTLYVAQLRGQGVMAVDLKSGKLNQIVSDFGRIRDVFYSDGYLYVITNNTDGRGSPGPADDRLIRIPLRKN